MVLRMRGGRIGKRDVFMAVLNGGMSNN